MTDRLVEIERWSTQDAEEATKQYRNYLFLRKKYPKLNLPPSKDIDEVWYSHVLHTQIYRNFCKLVFSNDDDQYLDHHPHIAREESMNKLRLLFEQTESIYHKEFGEYIYRIMGRSFFRRFLDNIRDYLIARLPTLSHALVS